MHTSTEVVVLTPLRVINTRVRVLIRNYYISWGVTVAKSPWTFIIICVVTAGTFALGLLNFTTENRPMKLWIPQDSGFVENSDWLQEHFPNDIRFHSMILEHKDNVLTPQLIQWVIRNF